MAIRWPGREALDTFLSSHYQKSHFLFHGIELIESLLLQKVNIIKIIKGIFQSFDNVAAKLVKEEVPDISKWIIPYNPAHNDIYLNWPTYREVDE